MGWGKELQKVRLNERTGSPDAQGSLTGMLKLSRRKTNRDAAALTGDGMPTQLGLGEAGIRTGLASIQEELGRMARSLATWLDHVAADARGAR